MSQHVSSGPVDCEWVLRTRTVPDIQDDKCVEWDEPATTWIIDTRIMGGVGVWMRSVSHVHQLNRTGITSILEVEVAAGWKIQVRDGRDDAKHTPRVLTCITQK